MKLSLVAKAQQAKFRKAVNGRNLTPPELAGEDARATISPGDDGGSVKLRPLAMGCNGSHALEGIPTG